MVACRRMSAVVVVLLSICNGSFVNAFSISDPRHFAGGAENGVSHASWFPARTIITARFATPATTGRKVLLRMAKPGQSESQKRQERENEIRSKLAQLKGSGKMKDGTSESIMTAAENFMNPKESPLRKFERAQKARQEAADAAAAAAALLPNEPDESTSEAAPSPSSK
jgi:hypothetical protein